MTGYQKLKKENEILWANLKQWVHDCIWLRENADGQTAIEETQKELAWIKAKIENETK